MLRYMLANARKSARSPKVILHSQLALEQVALRLDLVLQFGEVAQTMKPVAAVVKTIKTQLQGILPEVSMELASVNDSLEDLASQVGDTAEESFAIPVTGEDSQKILSEANVVAEQKMRERFPDLPPCSSARSKNPVRFDAF